MSIINKGYTGGQLDDQVIIDHTDAEALLVRKDADGGDIFTVDTALSNVLVDARLKMGTSQPFWPAVGKAAGIQFLGTAATRAGIIYDTDEGMSLVAGDNDGNGNHVVALVSGGNVLKDHDHDTFQTDPTMYFHSATDPDTDNTQYGSLRHDQTDFVIDQGLGSTKLAGGTIMNRTAVGAGAYTTLETDYIVAKTAITASGDTVTLETDTVKAGKVVIIKDESGGAATDNITIATEGAETIDGAATITISADYGVARVYSNGTNWFTF